MPKIICDWDTCRHNEEGMCTCADEVKLVDKPGKDESSLLKCETFEWREDE